MALLAFKYCSARRPSLSAPFTIPRLALRSAGPAWGIVAILDEGDLGAHQW